ncbi:hypothetical protein [Amycolatopsis sp. YIM 10]|uniref:hypothetical protein n=1 Tax=Amycolatopsis sp. YIM 10 TaxID=2653857 RepID=UPI00129025E4|nr:hypothetical protein [Amycolatopsis sp. YIM 10]
MASRNVTRLFGMLDRPLGEPEAVALAERMYGADLIAVAVRERRFGVASRTDDNPYPALELAGQAFVEVLAEAGFTVKSWESVEWLSGAEAQLREDTEDFAEWLPAPLAAP